MKLYFSNSKDERRIIAEPKNRDEVQKAIYEFCEDRNFEIHYVRTWRDNNGLEIYDVGSWIEFFVLDDRD